MRVLLLPGVPIAAIGLAALPWTVRGIALRLLVVFSVITFVATTLLLPVSTTWGTFLHASAAVQVLLLISALVVLDRLLAAIGRRRAWTRPVAWLAPTLGIAAGALFTVALLPTFGRDGDGTRDRYAALPQALADAGAGPPVGRLIPGSTFRAAIITDFPIYLAETNLAHGLALPDESPAAVLDLARHFPGAYLLIVNADNDGIWPEIATTDPIGIKCFEPIALDTAGNRALDAFRVFRITCP